MKKLQIGDWVFDEKTDQFGRVMNYIDGSRSVKVRWLGSRKVDGDEYSSARLIHKTPSPFIMEGMLEGDIYSPSRSERPLLETWLRCFGSDISGRSIYSVDDIEIMTQEIKSRHPPFVHINCHGDFDTKSNRPFIVLFKDRIYLDEPRTIEAFRHLKGYSIFFSACNLGQKGDAIKRFQEDAGLGAVAVSSREILDPEAMLYGLMLYQAILDGGLEFEAAVGACNQAGKLLGIKGRQGHSQSYVRLFPSLK